MLNPVFPLPTKGGRSGAAAQRLQRWSWPLSKSKWVWNNVVFGGTHIGDEGCPVKGRIRLQ